MTPTDRLVGVAVCGALALVAWLVSAVLTWRARRLVSAPTIDAKTLRAWGSTAVGRRVYVLGRPSVSSPLRAPGSGLPCLQYLVEVVSTYRDDHGQPQWHHEIELARRGATFGVRDASGGEVLVDATGPMGADATLGLQVAFRGSPTSVAFGAATLSVPRIGEGDYIAVERCVPVSEVVYVSGEIALREGDPVVVASPGADVFVSTRPREASAARERMLALVLAVMGAAFAAMSAAVALVLA